LKEREELRGGWGTEELRDFYGTIKKGEDNIIWTFSHACILDCGWMDGSSGDIHELICGELHRLHTME
jgi:hypothetical protein